MLVLSVGALALLLLLPNFAVTELFVIYRILLLPNYLLLPNFAVTELELSDSELE